MYSKRSEDPIREQIRKIVDLTYVIFKYYKDINQKGRAYNLIIWVVTALQAVIEQRQRLYIVKPFTPEKVRLAYMRAKANASNRYYLIPEAP